MVNQTNNNLLIKDFLYDSIIQNHKDTFFSKSLIRFKELVHNFLISSESYYNINNETLEIVFYSANESDYDFVLIFFKEKNDVFIELNSRFWFKQSYAIDDISNYFNTKVKLEIEEIYVNFWIFHFKLYFDEYKKMISGSILGHFFYRIMNFCNMKKVVQEERTKLKTFA